MGTRDNHLQVYKGWVLHLKVRVSRFLSNMGRTDSGEDSDSAPEDIAFNDAKNDALEKIKTVSEAAKEKKKIRREANKKRQEVLKEQKEKKVKKLKDLESKKLPDSFLDTLADEVTSIEPSKKKVNVDKRENTKITFDEGFDSDEEDMGNRAESEDFIALETDATNFKVVTSRDLNSSKFKSSEAFNFREKMLFGSRIRREPYKNQSLKREKLKVCGKAAKVSAMAT
eukprot:TRINITY_DN3380_c0_g1_i1.p1 TRINITY_DN3380_c0_g1~~TRINITY_DN3380_c0_g1_i1.p1  ORF type:complete len:235 (+),score=90.89 TRINITY_DN3380_c0_g1_i1:26-706(+)